MLFTCQILQASPKPDAPQRIGGIVGNNSKNQLGQGNTWPKHFQFTIMAFLSTIEDVRNYFKNKVVEAEAKLIDAKTNEFMAGLMLDYGFKPVEVAVWAKDTTVLGWYDIFRKRPFFEGITPEIWQILESRFTEFKHGLYQ